jgi:beta-alanine degradation protein BauB
MPTSENLLDRRQMVALFGVLGVPLEALAQDAARVNPHGFTVLLDNDRVRVLEYKSRPGAGVCGQGVHSHPPHVNIVLTPIKARVTLPDGKAIEVENKPGDVFWEGAVTHTVENIGRTGARAYMVELKG